MKRKLLETTKDSKENSAEFEENRKMKQRQRQKKRKQSISKERVRSPKRLKNALKNFKVCYQNVRGLKSKLD